MAGVMFPVFAVLWLLLLLLDSVWFIILGLGVMLMLMIAGPWSGIAYFTCPKLACFDCTGVSSGDD